MLKLFNGVITADKDGEGFVGPCVGAFYSHAEATVTAYQRSLECWPVSKGFLNHKAVMFEVNYQMIIAMVEQNKQGVKNAFSSGN